MELVIEGKATGGLIFFITKEHSQAFIQTMGRYSTNGTKWNKIEYSLDISGFHHNAFGGFLAVRTGLCSMGEGTVTFKNFKYNPIK